MALPSALLAAKILLAAICPMVTPSVSDWLSGIAARESVSAVSKVADWLGYK